MNSYYKLRQLLCYKVQHDLLQIATGITKCDLYYKLYDSTNQSLLVRWHVNFFSFCRIRQRCYHENEAKVSRFDSAFV